MLEAMDKTAVLILIEGNEAGALGSLFGGVNLMAWYPITPSTSLADGLIAHRHIRDDENGKSTVAIVQAEDELAAIGMLVGAGWAGARAMTATSGPGISLMTEFAGLAYYAEVPIVVWDVTRMGPSTGLPTRTSQGDLLMLHFLGHGDTTQICLIPGTVAEAFEFGWRAFDIAEVYQTPVFVASDLDLGMNTWMSAPFAYPDTPIQRGKVLDEAGLEAFIAEHGQWGRYRDVDGDGIGYRTVPGINHPQGAYFARGTGHNAMAVYSERQDDWVENMTRLHRKIQNSREALPAPITDIEPDRRIGILTHGTNEPAIEEARDRLADQGILTNYMRVRALPLTAAVTDFINQHDTVYVVENNFDGQLHQIIRIDNPQDIRHVRALALGDSLPMTADWVIDQILANEEK
jgi:2-oxoglutarate/2-oxoacid ferredoxin oxidoreductase subunit alpha